jgi:hypothetical protein
MLEDKDRIFQNLYNDGNADLKSAMSRGDWLNTKELCQKGKEWLINEYKYLNPSLCLMHFYLLTLFHKLH